MTPNTRLYDALNVYLRQCQELWRDVRHLQSICWMMLGIIQSEKVHPSGFGVYVTSRVKKAQSKQRRFRRNLSNRRINLAGVHQQLMGQALSQWGLHRLYLSLDTTMLWNCFCVIWVGVVYRGRTLAARAPGEGDRPPSTRNPFSRAFPSQNTSEPQSRL